MHCHYNFCRYTDLILDDELIILNELTSSSHGGRGNMAAFVGLREVIFAFAHKEVYLTFFTPICFLLAYVTVQRL
jgi:hypothetical protein